MTVIEISNSSYNGTSSLLSIIILIAFVYFTILTGAKIYRKMNPNIVYNTPNIFTALIQNTMLAIQYNMKDIVKKQYNDRVASYDQTLDDMKTTLRSSSNYMDMVSIAVGSLNEKVYSNFKNNLATFDDFLKNAKNVVSKINDISNQNIKNFEEAYKQFQQRLKSYVDNLYTMLSTIGSHITTSSVIPSLANLIPPLQKIYQSIYDTLSNNKDFIHSIDPDFVFDTSKLPNPSSAAKTSTASSFRATSAILRNSGYK